MNKNLILPLALIVLNVWAAGPALAEPPPAPWVGEDVGEVEHHGGVDYSGGSFKINGSGGEIWETSDSFYFVSQPLPGDGTITAHFKEGLQFVDPYAKAGVMIRASNEANAPNAFLGVTSLHGAIFQNRAKAGGPSTSQTIEGEFSSAAKGEGLWLKLDRSGGTLTAYTSLNGKDWERVGGAEIDLPGEALIGLAMTSHDASQQYGFATLDSVEVTSASSQAH